MEHLIANTGIQFLSTEAEFNPSEPLNLENFKTLKYHFCEAVDLILGLKTFDLLFFDDSESVFIPLSELRTYEGAVMVKPNGREELDMTGLIKKNPEFSNILFSTYEDGHPEIYTINSLQSLMVKDPADGHTTVPAFDLLLDKWLPMPMFMREIDGISANAPLGWCRVKIHKTGPGSKKGTNRYRLLWAFDTELTSDPTNLLRPFIDEGDRYVDFALCNKVDQLLEFMSSGDDFHAFSDYIASILGLTDKESSMKYKAYYIYLVNFLRLLKVAPEVRLYSGNKKIDVDLVLDIGNSRTCGILFENGEFTKGKMLALRDLTFPDREYENKTFDMRVVFRKADFGNDIVLDENMFAWKSFVRIGEEARRLVYRSLEQIGVSETTTNYSSPKRYLWDMKPYEGQWENLVTTDDPYNVSLANDIYIPGMSDLFDAEGKYKGDKEDLGLGLDLTVSHHHYSRSSLMTFAFIEIFLQAIQQINSVKYRQQWGDIDCKRRLRNIVITCPTAMPISEQITLRSQARDAFKALTRCIPDLDMPKIVPDPDAISPKLEPDKRQWIYDEASCCQLVYLYAEIAQRYSGEIHKFFETKGHVREELAEEGYEGKALTIGTVDIGAGTTDLMICAYECEGEGRAKINPVPIFWDSFYLAGDDIVRNLVQNIVIEGREHDLPDQGNISSALVARIQAMTDEQIRNMPCVAENIVYRGKVNDIVLTADEEEKKVKKTAFAANIIHDFFGTDSAMMSFRDRRCRTDFNTQISVPIVYRMMELLRNHRPSRLYTYEEMFPDIKPSSYLLDYFEHHFGFRFEELNWRYDPEEVTTLIKATMEPLLKQLAMVLYSKQCDIIVLAGRPTSLDAITELFIKYLPISPDRLVRLNDYRVGNWFPTADGQGYFYDQKAIVAVGGMVGFLASTVGLPGLVIDFKKMIKNMHSTANYVGEYNSRRQQVPSAFLSPINSTATLNVSVFPAYIGCRLLDSSMYQARPFYAIYNNSNKKSLKIIISRNFYDDREQLAIEEVMDNEGNTIPKRDVELLPQSLADDGKYWLDKGEFELTIK